MKETNRYKIEIVDHYRSVSKAFVILNASVGIDIRPYELFVSFLLLLY